MKIFRAFFTILLFATISFESSQTAFAFGKKDSESEQKKDENQERQKTDDKNAEKEQKSDEFIKIDLYLDTTAGNPKNHFIWYTKSSSYKDCFDAVSGASKVHSTKYFRDATYDTQGKILKAPKGLRNLCLFAVSNPENLKKDDFKIEKNGINGKKLLITFTHREISYKIETDENGVILVPESFYIKDPKKADDKVGEKDSKNVGDADSHPAQTDAPVATAAEPEKSDDKDNLKSPEEIAENEFKADVPAESLKMIYQGKLKAKLSENGVLTMTGKLKLLAREK